jgi:putative redox protein
MQTASVQWIGEQKFVAISPSGHAITIDSDRSSNKAPGPMELVLMALGACTATDVVIVLGKKRQKLQSLIQLSEEKYCSVSATLRKTATLAWRFEILPPL